MFTIEKPKEIHLGSWRAMFDQLEPSINSSKNGFELFWSMAFKENNFAFSAKNEGEFMGFCLASVHSGINEHYLYMEILFIEPQFRKLGVGRALLNKLEETASDLNLDFYVHGIEKVNLVAQRLFTNYEKVDRIIYRKKFH